MLKHATLEYGDKMKILEVIIVEGKNDTAQLKRAVECDTIETNGSAINASTLQRIRFAHERRGVIVFTDADYPGEKIRKKIMEVVSDCKHAYISSEYSQSSNKKKVGIEHASIEAIRMALSSARQMEESQLVFTARELIDYGLLSGANAHHKRKLLGDRLGIGHSNGKQLLQKLHMFRISREEFEQAIESIQEDELS